jgi:calcium-dependent protein kinase
VKQRERLATEMGIMEMLDHPNILRLFETYEDENNLYMLLEY